MIAQKRKTTEKKDECENFNNSDGPKRESEKKKRR
jgi:hypothetical protein